MEAAKRRDVFLSYSHDEQDIVARPLALALRDRGVSLWFDEYELLPGDSLRRSIDEGLRHARIGLVIVSKGFFAREWPRRELDGLTTRSIAGELRIVPVWHEVGEQEVRAFSPPLADLKALTSGAGADRIAEAVSQLLRRRDGGSVPLPIASLSPVPRPRDASSAPRVARAAPESSAAPAPTSVTVAMLGHAGHGKTTLLAALVAQLGEGDEVIGLDEIERAVASAERGVGKVTFATEWHRYRLVDYATEADRARDMIAAATPLDGAILVVSLADGWMSQTSEQLLLARKAGVRRLVVYLSKADIADEEHDDHIEEEVRRLLAECGFLAADVPMVLGSALRALEGDEEDRTAIRELAEDLDATVDPAARATGGPLPAPVKSRTIQAHVRFVAELYVNTAREGGLHGPLFRGYRPLFDFGTAIARGVLALRPGDEMIRSGAHDEIQVELVRPVALEPGVRFAVREAGRTVGVGVVTTVGS